VAIIPVIVVPDGFLWQIDYAASGMSTKAPRQVARTTLLCRHNWVIPHRFGSFAYTVSHQEIITLGGLAERLNYLAGDNGLFA
jgi:hypothetical protein